jgi:hypothetical protein
VCSSACTLPAAKIGRVARTQKKDFINTSIEGIDRNPALPRMICCFK